MITRKKSEMQADLAAFCLSEGLPVSTYRDGQTRPVTAEFLLKSPDSLRPSQRKWLVQFRDDYSDAVDDIPAVIR